MVKQVQIFSELLSPYNLLTAKKDPKPTNTIAFPAKVNQIFTSLNELSYLKIKEKN